MSDVKLRPDWDNYYCKECECLCSLYDQGLTCQCSQPWEEECLDEEKYPNKWIRVTVSIKEKTED